MTGYLIHDRESKVCDHFDKLLRLTNIEPVKLPPRSPNLYTYAECFIFSAKSESLDRMILFSHTSLQHVLREYAAHYHLGSNNQGIGNNLICPQHHLERDSGRNIECRESIGASNRPCYANSLSCLQIADLSYHVDLSSRDIADEFFYPSGNL